MVRAGKTFVEIPKQGTIPRGVEEVRGKVEMGAQPPPPSVVTMEMKDYINNTNTIIKYYIFLYPSESFIWKS